MPPLPRPCCVRRVLIDEFAHLDGMARNLARHDAICRRLMTVPGVGVIVALTYRTGVDGSCRFRRCFAVSTIWDCFVICPSEQLALPEDPAGGIGDFPLKSGGGTFQQLPQGGELLAMLLMQAI